jgi:peptidoglycan/LPS O-acetylase OafA/YrhL
VDVQALRGIAVLLVVLYHARVFPHGGFIGVDVFFVISGFVIGRLLLGELDRTDSLSLPSFYVRRARRLLPPLAGMLTTVVLLSPLLAPTGSTSVAPRTGAAAAMFGANAYLYRATAVGYFDPAAVLNPLLHTWSLSIEEQFYFVIPALLLLSWVIGRRRQRSLGSIRAFVALVSVISLAACLLLSYRVGGASGLRFAFYLPLTRAWEFAAGIAIVVLPAGWFRSPAVRGAARIVGFAAIAAGAVAFSDATRFPGIAAAVPTIGTALVIFGGTAPQGASSVGEARAWKPLVWMGDLSYSWYLWHWPCIVFVGGFWPRSGRLPLVLAGAGSLLPAWVSYRTLERRFRATSTTRTRPTIALAACCIAIPLVAVGAYHVINVKVSGKVSGNGAGNVHQDHIGRRSGCHNPIPLAERPAGSCLWGPKDAPRSAVLVGDSNADQFTETFIGAADAARVRLRVVSMSACPMVDEGPDGESEHAPACYNFISKTLAELVRHPPDLVIIANASDFHLASRASRTGYERGLAKAVGDLRSAGAKVSVIKVVPKPAGWDAFACSNLLFLTYPGRCRPPPFSLSADRVRVAANRLEEQAARDAGADTWDFADQICPNDRCTGLHDGDLVWRDGSHISVATSKLLITKATRLLSEALA